MKIQQFLVLIAAGVLMLQLMLHTLPAPSLFTRPTEPTAPTTPTILQFTAGEHVLGFTPNAVYAASGTHAYRVEFVDARPTTPLADAAPSTATGTAAQAVPLARVSYPQLWPGITLTYDAPAGALLRSTYRLEPNADPTHIRLRYNAPVQLESEGTLTIAYPSGAMHESAPVAWQETDDGVRTPVAVAFQTFAERDHQGQTVGFRLGEYNPALPLFIGPELAWNTFLGGSGNDNGYAITVDGNGNVFVAGMSKASWGSPIHPYTGAEDIFVARLDSSGMLVWNTFLGSSSFDEARSIAVDGNGNVFVAGYSDATWGTPIHPFTFDYDVVVARLDSSGTLAWNTFLGGVGPDYGWGAAVDGSGNVFVIGTSSSTWGSPVRPYAADDDAFVARLNSSGTLAWNTFLGGVGTDYGYGVAVDGSGNVFVAGTSKASWGWPVRPYTADDGFAARLNSSGTLVWNTFLGGTGSDIAVGVAVDGSGNVFIAGSSKASWGSPVRPYTANDAFAARLNSSGTLAWNTFLGGSAVDLGSAVAVDGNGNVYVAGHSFDTWGEPIMPYSDNIDAFAAGLNSSGVLGWHAFLGGEGTEYEYDLAVDGSGYLYVAGISGATWGVPVRPYIAQWDAFVVKLLLYQKTYLPVVIK